MNKRAIERLIFDLISQKSRLKKLKGFGEKLDKVIDVLYQIENPYDSDEALPDLKKVSLRAELNESETRQTLKKLYEFVIEDENLIEVPFKIETNQVFFVLESFKTSIKFKIDGLKTIPEKGTSFTIPFFTKKLGGEYFHVSEITNEFIDDHLETIIWLKKGDYNSYWELRKDKAKETREISIFDSMKTDSEIKNMLNISPESPW